MAGMVMDVMEMEVKEEEEKKERREERERKRRRGRKESKGHKGEKATGERSIKGHEFVNRPSNAVCLRAFGLCSPFFHQWEKWWLFGFLFRSRFFRLRFPIFPIFNGKFSYEGEEIR